MFLWDCKGSFVGLVVIFFVILFLFVLRVKRLLSYFLMILWFLFFVILGKGLVIRWYFV